MQYYKILFFLPFMAAACGEDQKLAAGEAGSGDTSTVAVEVAQNQLPQAVRKWITKQEASCRSEGNKFKDVGAAVKPLELNGDGSKDYALWEGGVICEGRPAGWFGNAGGQIVFAVSEGQTHKMHEGFAIPDWDAIKIESNSGRDLLVISDGEREVAWGWNGQKIALFKRSDRLNCTVEGEGGSLPATIVISQIVYNNGTRWSGKASVLPRESFPDFPRSMSATGTTGSIEIGKGKNESISLEGGDGNWQGAMVSTFEDGTIFQISIGCY